MTVSSLASSETGQRCNNYSDMLQPCFIISYILTVYCSMHSAVTISWPGKSLKKKKIQENLHSEEIYQEYNKIGKIKKRGLFPGRFISGTDCPRKSGRNGHRKSYFGDYA